MNRKLLSATQLLRRAPAVCRCLLVSGLLLGLGAGASAQSSTPDSFFDIFLDLWDSGQVIMEPADSDGAFPFPPPPLDFPDIDDLDLIDIQLETLNLVSSQPMQISPGPDNSFTVDSFFDIEYQITFDNGSGPAPIADSFFDIAYQIEVFPGRTEFLPEGELQTFDIELVSLSLTSVQPIDLPGQPDVEFSMRLSEGFAAGLDGHVTVLKLAGGGDFQVDSFFDIFIELSVDGGNTFHPSSQDSQLRMQSFNEVPIPEPATGGLLALALASAAIAGRRR